MSCNDITWDEIKSRISKALPYSDDTDRRQVDSWPGEQVGAVLTLSDGTQHRDAVLNYGFSGVRFIEYSLDDEMKPLRTHFYPYSQIKSIIEELT